MKMYYRKKLTTSLLLKKEQGILKTFTSYKFTNRLNMSVYFIEKYEANGEEIYFH